MSVAELVAARAAWNPRTMPAHDAAALKTSLERFGLVEPLVFNSHTKRLVGGHQRLDALVALGETQARVVVVDFDENDEKVLNLALNRIHGEWDWSKLDALMDELRAVDVKLPEIAGFTEEEIARIEKEGHLVAYRLTHDKEALRLLETADEAVVNDVEDVGPAAPTEKVVTRRGDLWLLGEHRLLCGDSTIAADVARVLDGEKAALMATDPPYCVDYTGTNRPSRDGRPGGKDWSGVYREVDIEDLGAFLDAFLAACLPHLRESAPLYVWHAHVQQPTIAQVFDKYAILFHQVIVWVKPAAVFGHSYYHWRHEPAAFGWRKGEKPPHRQRQLDTVWEVDWDGKARFASEFHPMSKPSKLFEIPIALHTRPGDVVFEPFCGSGSQVIAAERLGRRCRAIELSPAFVDGTIRRFESTTGKKAVLDGDGRTFDEVARGRAGEGESLAA